MNSMQRLFFAASLLTAFTSCGRGGDIAQENMAPSGESSGTGQPGETESGGMLTADPAVVEGCNDGDPIVALISWEARLPEVEEVLVEVAGKEGASTKLFSQGGKVGSARTEKWVKQGTIFYLRDAKTGLVIDKLVIGSSACES